ncbi:hypothetical protein AUJ66_08745 [Candidatus Desantisbacteria bacterium CG1_02_38_46]|uniref:Uncharacterized protein n=3 Tax=unclassified Candidatus Desantisiibacteriota TaxID=3106372 RepID=A0A2M7SFI4_9BACT|nr:MAG: hypothetical protein AUJ66_08745 [Candidatus Desantisbacteria bacterium CG1_02_38_46]PIU51023.1 MAG: hypothetical protein COS91_06485 [Candidatus Desantisbacteria bacterium CG07_land_8_20_14_0_80_39_15]PIZ18244.1 MAG: hypothetical protein COY52_00495 [Candidatus Desantisbacteria bacterium CG_4_10_14_0_8_um_filter_48_22]
MREFNNGERRIVQHGNAPMMRGPRIIERKRIIERIVSNPIAEDGKLIDVVSTTFMDAYGGIYEVQEFRLRYYDCGHLSFGRKNFGGICFNGCIVCNSCITRCCECGRLACSRCITIEEGKIYCNRCRGGGLLRLLGFR